MRTQYWITPFTLALLLLGLAWLAAPAVAAPTPKVEICHIPPGNPANFHTITISENALSAHLAHGDVAGSCNSICDQLCSDNDVCTIDHLGSCEEDGCLPSGERPSVNCDDGNACTEDELCHPTDGCSNAAQPGNSCDDGDACTDADICDESGGCAGDSIENCCVYNGDCDDDNLCTDDLCNGVPENPSGMCGHEVVECEDPDACRFASCNPLDGSCTEMPRSCDDGLGCTDDTCEPASGCVNDAVDCQPPDACHTSSCAEPGMCMDMSIECLDDDVACTDELCDPVTGCESIANDANCNDNNECSIDRCVPSSPSADGCTHDAIANCCSATVDCPAGQVCDGGVCVPDAASCPCWDGSDGSVGSSLEQVWMNFAPADCERRDQCEERAESNGSERSLAVCIANLSGSPRLSTIAQFSTTANPGVQYRCQVLTEAGALVARNDLNEQQYVICRDEHDAFTAPTQFPPVPPGGTDSIFRCGLPTP